jgi:hypothetical protein
VEARARPAVQARLDEVLESVLRLICQGDEVFAVIDEVVMATVKGLVLVDPVKDTEVVASRCGR